MLCAHAHKQMHAFVSHEGRWTTGLLCHGKVHAHTPTHRTAHFVYAGESRTAHKCPHWSKNYTPPHTYTAPIIADLAPWQNYTQTIYVHTQAALNACNTPDSLITHALQLYYPLRKLQYTQRYPAYTDLPTISKTSLNNLAIQSCSCAQHAYM